jgi:hypothetical protein
MRWVILLLFFVLNQHWVKAEHLATFTIQALEWNGQNKWYKKSKSFDVTFTQTSEKIFIDSINGNPIYATFQFLPMLRSDGFEYGFKMLMWEEANPRYEIEAKTMYQSGTFEASAKQYEGKFIRKWTGELRYFPDTAIKASYLHWQEQHALFRIGRIEVMHNGKKYGTVKRNLTLDAITGSSPVSYTLLHKHGEKMTLELTPIRCLWGNENWQLMHVKVYLYSKSGVKSQILGHTFSSKDKSLKPNYVSPNNAFELTDRQANMVLLAYVQFGQY